MAVELDAAKRKKILESSKAMFFREGISSLTMDQIASRQGISKKTLYKYFANKNELVEAALEERLQEVAAEVDAIACDRSLSFPTRLSGIMKVISRQLVMIGETLMKDIVYREPELWERIDQFRREKIFSVMSSLFEEGIRSGFVRTDIESRLVPTLFVTTVSAVLSPAQFFALDLPAAVIFDTLIRILLVGALTEEGKAAFLAGEVPG